MKKKSVIARAIARGNLVEIASPRGFAKTLFLGFALTLFTNCSLKDRFKEMVSKVSSPAEPHSQKVVKGRNTANMTTECCWCYLLAFRENEVNPYVSPELCEKIEETRNARCRKIRVLGTSCSFLNTAGGKVALDCDVRPLKYLEDGEVKLIEPPNADIGPCHKENIKVKADVPLQEGQAEKSEGGRCFWSCGANELKKDECVATVYQDDVAKTSQSLPKPVGKAKCDVPTCLELFSDKFYGLCPTFENGASEK